MTAFMSLHVNWEMKFVLTYYYHHLGNHSEESDDDDVIMQKFEEFKKVQDSPSQVYTGRKLIDGQTCLELIALALNLS